jgi:hypothetical protein
VDGGTITPESLQSESKDHFGGFPSHLISSGDITKHHEKWLQIEHLPAQLADGRYILNLRNEHWIVLILQHPLVFIFDPLSTKVNKKDIPTHHPELTKWLKARGFTHITANDVIVQPKHSNLCGYFCLWFVKHVPKGHLTEESFDSFIHSEFKGSDDDFNVKKLVAWCNGVGLT